MFTFSSTTAIKTSSSYAQDDKKAGHAIWKNFDWLPSEFHKFSNSIKNDIEIRYQKLPANRLLTVNADNIENGIFSKISITLSERIHKSSYKVLGQAKIDRSEFNFPQEITASKSGEIYGIAQSITDGNFYLLAWDRKGNQKFSRLLHQRRTPNNRLIDDHYYSSIDHDNEGNIYITGFFDDHELGRYYYETHVYIEKRNAITGNLIWRSTPFAEQISGSIRNGTHPTLLTTDGKVLVSGSGYFWIDKSKDPNLNNDNGTYIAKLDPRSGLKLDQIKISDNTDYLTEFATRGEDVFFSTDNESFILDGIKAASSGNELWDFTSTPKKMSEHNKVQIGKPIKFKIKSIDKITNFNPSTDTLEIDTDSFGIDSSATFASGKNKKAVKKKLAKQDFDFLYDEKKGGLYFNENGADKGFGDGGIIAILQGAPDLTSSNLEFI